MKFWYSILGLFWGLLFLFLFLFTDNFKAQIISLIFATFDFICYQLEEIKDEIKKKKE